MSVYDQTKPKANRVFISYSSIDRVRTKGLGLLLESMGHQVFHDHRTIKPGMKWEAALQDGLDQADAVMVFWTKHAAKSDWVRKEYEYFSATFPDRLLVPVLGDETPLTEILKTRQQADFAPLVNEVLETKRRMKREGASTSEIESAVMSRLGEAGVDINTKRKRAWVFLLLGFGWLRTLLRYPLSVTRQLGSGAVEKTAQLSLGHAAMIGAVGVFGFAGGWNANTAMEREANLPVWAGDVQAGVTTMGGNVRSLETSVLASRDDMSAKISHVTDSIVQIDRRLTTITESRQDIVRRLVTILDEVRDADSLSVVLAACQDSSAALTQTATESRRQVAALQDSLRLVTTEDVVAPPPVVDGIDYIPPDVAGNLVDPVPLSAPMPAMPAEARQRGVQGDVRVTAVIDTAGNVTVETFEGPRELEAATRAEVDEWTFIPGTRNGVPMEWRMTTPVNFVFKDIDFSLPTDGTEGVLVQPQPLSAPYPRYPRPALNQRIEGTAIVSAAVQRDGSVSILQVTGDRGLLNVAAEEAVKNWKFKPGTRNGEPIVWEFTVPVVFRLRS